MFSEYCFYWLYSKLSAEGDSIYLTKFLFSDISVIVRFQPRKDVSWALGSSPPTRCPHVSEDFCRVNA